MRQACWRASPRRERQELSAGRPPSPTCLGPPTRHRVPQHFAPSSNTKNLPSPPQTPRQPAAMADKPKPAAKQASPLKDAYLILYNFASAVAWSVVLGRTLAVLYLRGPAAVYAVVGEWTKWTQTAAVMEILHSLLGILPLTSGEFPPFPPKKKKQTNSQPI